MRYTIIEPHIWEGWCDQSYTVTTSENDDAKFYFSYIFFVNNRPIVGFKIKE